MAQAYGLRWLFTKGISKDEAIQHTIISENESLARKVFDTVAIIA